MAFAESSMLLAVASTGLAGLAIFTAAVLRGWSEWLEFKRLQAARSADSRSGGGRIEIADLRSRVRKLEAIASGIEL
ncbi:MAG: hypothetical protein JWO25_179 [Alphaproteobacteria bacterium]|nr:hypothetical protein [Alphaproteobacteria bacterium]